MKDPNQEEKLENEKPKRKRISKVAIEEIAPSIEEAEETPKKIVLKEKKKTKEVEINEIPNTVEVQNSKEEENNPEVVKIDFKKEAITKKPFKQNTRSKNKNTEVDLFATPESESEAMPSNEATEMAAPMEEKV